MKTIVNTTPGCADPWDVDSISVDQALSQITDSISALQDCEELPIRDCLGRISSESVISPINVPGHANSAMDGFAVPAQSLPEDGVAELTEIGTAYAGKIFDGLCQQGECVRIMTGAVIPEGTDTVIMQEQVDQLENKTIRIGAGHRAGENVRYAGEDITEGETVLANGSKINPADLGILASLGIGSLKVLRKPVIAFFSTGDELVSIDKPLQKGEIYDSNRYTLHGMLSQLPVDIVDLGVIEDDPDAIRTALLKASQTADLIITTGGVSVGEADYIKPVLEDIGEIEFWKIAIKPGRPLTYGSIGNSIFMGLPGNPVAVMVTFSLFVRAAIRKLSGAPAWQAPLVKARAMQDLRKKAGRHEFLRGIASTDANNGWQVEKTGMQGSGILTSMSRANCFIVLPAENNGVKQGELVDVQLFDHI
ncbi:MAG: gephyrin-like molybdotransferase Glp [Gammaproteobacteria bacterium]